MRIRRSGKSARRAQQAMGGSTGVPGRRRHLRIVEALEPRRMLHHAGGDDELPEIGIYATYIKPDDYVDTEYEAELAAGAVAASPLTSIPILHSLAGATASIYLDFDGHYEAVWGSYSNITTPVFDIDGDATTFSETELTRMTNIWKRVAEDFAPFQIDVTTENPGNFSNGHGLRVAIGGGGGWLGSPAGGVAYIGNFTNSVANTVYVFPDALSKNEKSIAEASSHEAGHAFKLQHQSLFDASGIKLQEYNPGGGGWAPIMGVSYYNALSTWYDGTSSQGSTTFQDDLAVISSPLNGFGYRPDDHLDTVGSGTPLAFNDNAVSGAGIIEYMTDVDAFSFSTDAGPITLNLWGAPLGPNLDGVLELRDSLGNLVASANPSGSLNATISTTVAAGDYTLLVKSTGVYGRIGQYSITGTVNAGLFAAAHSPAEGSVVTALPTDFEIKFSEPIVTAGLTADLLLVNGQAADTYSIVNGDTLAFHFNTSPVSSQGLQSMTMAAGSVLTLADNSPLNPFVGSFRYDVLPLAVTATSPLNGSTATLPLVALQVDFNEPYDPNSISLSDLVLNSGTVTGVTFDDADTATFSIAGVSVEGTIEFSLAAGAIVDLFGNPLVAYAGSVSLDYGTNAYPMPLTYIDSLGGATSEPSLGGAIGFVGDADSFTIDLPAGAKLSVVVTAAASLRPTVELLGPGNSPLASTTAAAAGLDAVIQTAASGAGGQYTVRVSGVGATTGAYTLHLVLDAAVEQEQHQGGANNTPGTAQSISAGFIDLAGGISRAGVLGVTDPDTGPLPQESEPNNSYATANLASHNFGPAAAGLYQLGLKGTVSSSSDVDWYRLGTMQTGDILTISMSGTGGVRGTLADSLVELYRGSTSSPVLVTSNDDSGAGLDALIYQFTVTTNDTYFLRAKAHTTGTYQLGVMLKNSGTVPNTGGSVTTEVESNNTAATATNVASSWRLMQYVSATTGSITTGDVDFFAHQLNAGDVVTLLADATSGSLDATVALLNSAGTVIASEDGTSGGLGADSPLYAYIIPTTGTYYVRTGATAGTGDYTTSVWLSSTIAPTPPVARGDYYSFSLAPGESVSVGVRALAAGAATASLTDSLGNVLSAGTTGSTNFDQTVSNYVAPIAGVYYVRVDGGFNVPYSLMVVRGAGLDAEGNDDPDGPVKNLGNLQGAVGHLNANTPSRYGSFELAIDPQQTYVTLGGMLSEAPLDEQSPGSLTAAYSGVVVADRQTTFVQFPAGSHAVAVSNPGPFLPNSSPATYAGQIQLGDDLFAYGKFSNIAFDLGSALLGPAGFEGGLGGLALGNFPANSVIFTFTSGVFDYAVPDLFSGSESLAGLSEVNQFDGPASLEEVDGVLQLVIPIFIETTLVEPTYQLPFNLRLEGMLVASLVLPGPIDPIDWYEVQLAAGEKLTVSTATPWDNTTLVPVSTLDPQIRILNASGLEVASDLNSAADGKNALLTYVATAAGTYRIGVSAESGQGDYVLQKSIAGADPAPRVVNVAVRGADGLHPWYDIPTGSGDQLKTVPVGRVDQISVTFSTTVNADLSDISLTGLGDRLPYMFSGFSYSAATNTATWTLDEIVDTDQLWLTLNADGINPITNLAGEPLDGDWTNPAGLETLVSSSYPSGNNSPGGDFIFNWRVSPGDGNQDYVVDGGDYTIWANHFLLPGGLATSGDFNTDGIVDGGDYTIWANHFAPAPFPAAPVESSLPQTMEQLTEQMTDLAPVDLALLDSPSARSAQNFDLAGLALIVEMREALAGSVRRDQQRANSQELESLPVVAGLRTSTAAVRQLAGESRSVPRDRSLRGIAVDQWMRELALTTATQQANPDDVIGEVARGWSRTGRNHRG